MGTPPPAAAAAVHRRLRLRLLSTAAQLVTTGRRHILRLAKHWPWTHLITEALARLDTLPNPG